MNQAAASEAEKGEAATAVAATAATAVATVTTVTQAVERDAVMGATERDAVGTGRWGLGRWRRRRTAPPQRKLICCMAVCRVLLYTWGV